ncbi:MAG TPA: hypothetical protein VMN99_09265 [Anaerolineales bacterium]|nr:hypothetical protein [Anaerolineales bacterium]
MLTKTNSNFIRPGKHGSQVVLDPDFLLCHALYMPDGQTVIKSNMTLGQAIEAIAFAHIKARMPHLADKCNAAKVEFKEGKFTVCFADSIDNLSL